MKQVKLFISEYDIICLEKVLRSIEEDWNIVMQRHADECSVHFSGFTYLSIGTGFDIAYCDGFVLQFSLSESNPKEHEYYHKKYCITLSGESEVRARALVDEIRARVACEMPDVFVSLEHLHHFLDKPVEMTLTVLSENLLVGAQDVIDRLFSEWCNRGIVSFVNNHDRRAEKLRVEVRDGVFRYVNINTLRVFERNGVVVAVGVTAEKPISGKRKYLLSAITNQEHSEKVESIFDEEFEDSLIENIDIRGGKFTGDQKIIKLSEKLTLDDINLEDAVREKLEKEIFNFFNMESFYRKAGIPFKRGVVLYGPPGTGKTMIAKIIVSTMEQTVIWVKAGDVSTSDDINRVFRMARIGRPSVIILEDIDFYTEDRNNTSSNKVGIATLMSNLDGLEENDGILVVVTTNRLQCIEKAIIDRPGRIDSQIFLGELGRDCIARVLGKKLGSFRQSFGDFKDVVPKLTVMTGAVAVECSTMILRKSIEASSPEDSEIVISECVVQSVLKDFERKDNRRKLGFARE